MKMYAITSKKSFEVAAADAKTFEKQSLLRGKKLMELNLNNIDFDKFIVSVDNKSEEGQNKK